MTWARTNSPSLAALLMWSCCDIVRRVSELLGMVRRLRSEPGLSRNRHFDELSKPEVVAARRVLRRIRGIEREVALATSVAVRPARGGWLVTLDFPLVRARREAFLTGEERDLLRESEAVGHHFGMEQVETASP